MGSPKDKFKDFAIAFWKTAKGDLERADDALEDKAYSYAVFHAQQCCEKIVKAVLEMEEIFVRDHDVSDLFTIYILKKEKDEGWREGFYKILETLDWFKGAWQLPRYPHIREGRVVVPSEEYKEGDATKALEKVRFVFESLTKFLKERYGLDLDAEAFFDK